MKSIRLSLIVYFLVLLAGALGAVSFFVYERTASALDARLATSRQLLQQQYEQRRRDEQRRMDDELLHQAYTLASRAVSQSQFNRSIILQYSAPAGMLSAGHTPFGYVLTPLWLAEGVRSPVSWELRPLLELEIQLNEDFLSRDEENSSNFFQINTRRGRSWRSRTLGEHRIPFDIELFQTLQQYETKFDEFELKPGVHVRCLALRVPISRFLYLFPPAPKGRGGPIGGAGAVSTTLQPGVPNIPRPTERRTFSPSMIVQCAADTAPRDQDIARLENELKTKVQQLEKESRDTLLGLRLKLLWIGLATFAFIFAGGSLLIAIGLAPLKRLSDAVSRVSEKDFRLHYDGPPPPSELEPIVARLQHTLNLLRRAFEREKQATADISHELRTPIAGLLTTIDVALRKPRGAEEYRTTLQECRDIVKQTSNLVERLLTLSSIDARSDRLHPETVDAGELAEQCATLVRPLAKAQGLSFELQKLPVPVTTDPDKLREVMANLMHNAVEYNKPHGSVCVRVQPANGGVDIEVQDTGIGIAPEHREKIFERFFRADASRQATGIHAGLGLSIVRGYVQLMGGQITVESEVGRGSTFRVHIPSLSNGKERHPQA